MRILVFLLSACFVSNMGAQSMDAVRIEATADLKEAIASLAELREQIET